jgi:hypothetical protein
MHRRELVAAPDLGERIADSNSVNTVNSYSAGTSVGCHHGTKLAANSSIARCSSRNAVSIS